ncbi:glycoside hydrolase family 26 protein [Lacisediminihabitans sp.]|uniref:glycoside hydrolase family 26 protein n=1 Tax=Lacisediminihabitans sp. TaxID=2787631 RepID=UPI00374D68ED
MTVAAASLTTRVSATGVAALVLSPASGPVGTSVTVTASGFQKNTTGTLTAGSSTISIRTNGAGAFTVAWVVPATTAATLTLTATVARVSVSQAFTVTYPVTVPVISTAHLRFGVATVGGAQANTELDQVATLSGEGPSIVLSYYDFNQAAPIADLNSVAARGALSLLTWEPWTWGGGLNQTAYQSATIASGTYDAYITSWGTALAAWGKPVMLRYGHEMNGNWYPWADGVNGNASGSYVAAFRHVHDLLTAAGATNVTWVWCPNVPYYGSTPITTEYPGDAYVDEVALDGYNWGLDRVGGSWKSPSTVFGDGLSQIRALAPTKPIIVAETASSENGGSKAQWNTDLVSYLAAQPDITGFVWFDLNKQVDWRIDTSTTSASAFNAALAARR